MNVLSSRFCLQPVGVKDSKGTIEERVSVCVCVCVYASVSHPVTQRRAENQYINSLSRTV